MKDHFCLCKAVGRIALLVALGLGSCISVGSARAQERDELQERSRAERRDEVLDQVKEPEPAEELEWDPWEPFNEKTFWFNHQLDRFILMPIATGYNWLLPDSLQQGIYNALDNIEVVPRLTNNILQLKPGGSAREVARFAINSTIGIAGLFDVAKHGLGIEQSDEDTGQTLGYWGVGPGPYLILPFLPPTTVRDGIGLAGDSALSPLHYLKFVRHLKLGGHRESVFRGTTAGIAALKIVNERSLNLEKFASIEETVLDLYGAVRNAYLQSRAAAIKQ